MQPAADAMAEALAAVAMRAPTVPVVANVPAAPVTDPEAIRAPLVEQVTGTVRWRESVRLWRRAGVDRFCRGRRRQGADRPRQAHRRRDAQAAWPSARRDGRRASSWRATSRRREAAMFDLTGQDGAGHRRHRRHRRERSRARCMRRARRWRCPARAREVLEALAAELGERVACAAVRPRRRGRGRSAGAGGRGGDRAGSTFSSTMPASPATSSFMRMKDEDWDAGDRRQSDRRLPPVARRAARHDEARASAASSRSRRSSASPAIRARRNYAASKAGMIGMSKALAPRSRAATSPSTASRRASSRRR